MTYHFWVGLSFLIIIKGVVVNQIKNVKMVNYNQCPPFIWTYSTEIQKKEYNSYLKYFKINNKIINLIK